MSCYHALAGFRKREEQEGAEVGQGERYKEGRKRYKRRAMEWLEEGEICSMKLEGDIHVP